MIPHKQYSPEEVARLGHQIYARDIRSEVMPQHKGKFLVRDIVIWRLQDGRK